MIIPFFVTSLKLLLSETMLLIVSISLIGMSMFSLFFIRFFSRMHFLAQILIASLSFEIKVSMLYEFLLMLLKIFAKFLLLSIGISSFEYSSLQVLKISLSFIMYFTAVGKFEKFERVSKFLSMFFFSLKSS